MEIMGVKILSLRDLINYETQQAQQEQQQATEQKSSENTETNKKSP